MSKFNGVKTNNGAFEAKAGIRKWVLESIEKPKVLEVFCGSGVMYDMVWSNAHEYMGIDKRKFFGARNTKCGDAEKLITVENLDLYNIFDIDAYGSPYSILKKIVDKKVVSGDIGIVLTDGVNMDLKMGRLCSSIREMTGIVGHELKRAHKLHETLIKMIINYVSEKLCMRVDGVKIARGKTGAAMKYYAFILRQSVD